MAFSESDLALFYFDLAAREIDRIERGRVRIGIVHRYGVSPTPGKLSIRRMPGAEIVSAWLIFRGRSYHVPLSATHLILFDYLCWHCARGIAQTASEIEAGLNEHLFYVHHGSLARRRGPVVARSSRTNVRKQVQRIREEFDTLFQGENLPLDSRSILRNDRTSTREVRYSVCADVVWES